MELNNRKSHIDVLRIVAAVFVVFIHTPAFSVYQKLNGFHNWSYSAVSVIAKTSVPIFFMISGAVLLDKEESIGTILRKRVLRIVVVLFLFSLWLYKRMLPEGETFVLGKFLSALKLILVSDYSLTIVILELTYSFRQPM